MYLNGSDNLNGFWSDKFKKPVPKKVVKKLSLQDILEIKRKQSIPMNSDRIRMKEHLNGYDDCDEYETLNGFMKKLKKVVAKTSPKPVKVLNKITRPVAKITKNIPGPLGKVQTMQQKKLDKVERAEDKRGKILLKSKTVSKVTSLATQVSTVKTAQKKALAKVAPGQFSKNVNKFDLVDKWTPDEYKKGDLTLAKKKFPKMMNKYHNSTQYIDPLQHRYASVKNRTKAKSAANKQLAKEEELDRYYEMKQQEVNIATQDKPIISTQQAISYAQNNLGTSEIFEYINSSDKKLHTVSFAKGMTAASSGWKDAIAFDSSLPIVGVAYSDSMSSTDPQTGGIPLTVESKQINAQEKKGFNLGYLLPLLFFL